VRGGSTFNASDASIFIAAANASYADDIEVSAGQLLLGAGNHTLTSGSRLKGAGLFVMSSPSTQVTVEDVSLEAYLGVIQGDLNVSSGHTLTVT
jgi:hypothetical protein